MKWFVTIAVGLAVVLSATFMIAQALGWTDAALFTSCLEALRLRPAGRLLVGSVIATLLAADLFLPVPSSILMTLSGVFLGFLAGLAAAFLGAMASAILGFCLCRRLGQKAFSRLTGDKDTTRIAAFLDAYGAWAILLSRSVPMLTEVMSCLAGLSTMSFRRFLGLSVAGTLPLCAVYAWAGSRSQQAPMNMGWAVLLAFVIPGLGFAIVRRWPHRDRERAHGIAAAAATPPPRKETP